MMIEVGVLSKQKLGWTFSFLGGASLLILSRPMWTDGGLEPLMTGQEGGKIWWPIQALVAIAMLGMLVMLGVKILRHRGPALFVMEGDLHSFVWRSPIPISKIAAVSCFQGRLRSSHVELTLRDDTKSRIGVDLLVEPPSMIADRITASLGSSRQT